MNEYLGAVPSLGAALQKRGYTALTPVQKAVTGEEFEGRDLLVSAQTGSGKTVAFGLACAPTLLQGAERFDKTSVPMALIVTPTRELALQVKRELEWLYAETGARIASCVGGMDIRTERRDLERGAHIVVGTPGRLRDHIMRRSLDTREMKAVVMDEADEMLDLGFREDLEFILEAMPEERRTLLFSATVPTAIAKLAQQYQKNAARISTKEETRQHGDIEYRALVCAPRERENAIINVLRYYEAKNALVFCNTRATVNHMVSRLNNRGFSVVALSGELSQSERTHALQAMRDGRARVCVATDVAARGIDLPNLELVVHADLPTNPETLLHRSGRTGRAGRKGVSALMIDQKGRGRAERLLRFAKLTASWASPPSADEVIKRDEERLLADPLLNEPVRDDERAFVDKLTEGFSIEQLAAALLRAAAGGKSAPEDVRQLDVHQASERPSRDGKSREPREPRQRESFSDSVWVSLSVGRKQNAEPRWLIPMLCTGGDITKGDIGHIKMQPSETFVQLNADVASDFMDALGPNSTLEKNIRVSKVEGEPNFDNSDRGNSRPKRGKSGFKRDEQKPRGKEGKKPHRGKGDKASARKDETSVQDAVPKPKKAVWSKDGAKANAEKPKKEGWATKKSKRPDAKKGKKPFGKGPAGKPVASKGKKPSKKPAPKP